MGNRKKNSKKTVIACTLIFLLALPVLGTAFFLRGRSDQISPEELLVSYMSCIEKQDYDIMYDMLDVEALCHRVLLIGKGKLLLDGDTAMVRSMAGENLSTEESVAALYQRFGI